MQELVIVQLNDLHGYLAQHPEWVWGPDGLRFEQMGKHRAHQGDGGCDQKAEPTCSVPG